MSDSINASHSADVTSQKERTDERMAHILIVDDDTRIRTLLKRYLMDNGFRVTTSENAPTARKQLEGLDFDLIVLDIMMPKESGLDFLADLRKTSAVPVLLLTAQVEAEHRIAGLEVGADDYLPKPFEPRELLLRIEAILNRTRTVRRPTHEVSLGACVFKMDRGELWHGDNIVHLTSREADVLGRLARSPGKPLSRSELAGPESIGSERAVDVQITRLRRKIERDPGNPMYLQTVRSAGYVLIPD